MGRYDRDKDETVELQLHCHAETQRAMLLSDDGDESRAAWVPKSQIVAHAVERGKSGTVEVKRWIAEREGFL